MPRLTQEQALAGLQSIWQEVCGHPKDAGIPQAEDNVVDFWRDSRHFDSLDDVDFLLRVSALCGESVSDEDVVHWFHGGFDDPYDRDFEQWERDVKPTLTFGRLAQWISERASAPSFAPMNVAGRVCGPAGAFCGIAETIDTLAPGERFPPRTPILGRLTGCQLEMVWNRLSVYACGKLPDLKFPHRRVGNALVLAAGFVGLAGTISLVAFGHPAWLLVWLPWCAFAVWGALKFSISGDPLPPEIRTFRDLAYAMSGIMNGPETVRFNRSGSIPISD